MPGAGGSIRTAPGMTAPLTKRMGHEFCGAPPHYSTLQALRFGQVLGFRGSRQLSESVACSPLAARLGTPEEEAQWLSVIQWMAGAPDLDPAAVRPIIEFLQARFAADPCFSMKGRSVRALLELACEWRLRSQAPEGEEQSFRPSGFQAHQGPVSGAGDVIWVIDEILDSRALWVEGIAMHHCVHEYAYQIAEGECSIWSVRTVRGRGQMRALTVQVDHEMRAIVECCGPCNRAPSDAELSVLRFWAEENALRIDL
jgi:hypothetical protein